MTASLSANPAGGPPAELLPAGSLAGSIEGLVHGFTTNLPLSAGEGFAEAVKACLQPPWEAGEAEPLLLEQPHGTKILSLGQGAGARRRVHRATPVAGFDGARAGAGGPLLLCIRTADCVPLLAVDPEIASYAALHAGWRGVAGQILPNLLQQWRAAGSSLARVRLALGPAIQPCCFEVKEDCLAAFRPDQIEGARVEKNGATFLDLGAVLVRQAGAWGVGAEQIEALGVCTSCHRDHQGGHPFASYRRSRRLGQPTGGRNAAFIGIRRPQ